MPSADALGERVSTIVARVLGIPANEASHVRRDQHPAWNSLRHIEIVFQVEEEFNMLFEEDDIAHLIDVDSIVAAVERRHGR